MIILRSRAPFELLYHTACQTLDVRLYKASQNCSHPIEVKAEKSFGKLATCPLMRYFDFVGH